MCWAFIFIFFCIRHLVHDNHSVHISNPLFCERFFSFFSAPMSSLCIVLYSFWFCFFCQFVNVTFYLMHIYEHHTHTHIDIHTRALTGARKKELELKQSTNTASRTVQYITTKHIIYNVSENKILKQSRNICHIGRWPGQFNRIPAHTTHNHNKWAFRNNNVYKSRKNRMCAMLTWLHALLGRFREARNRSKQFIGNFWLG